MEINKVTFVIHGNAFINKTVGSIKFSKWGDPIDVDIRYINKWSHVHKLKFLKEYVFFIKAGTVFVDIEAFFKEIKPLLLKSGIGHIVYNANDHSVSLNDQALLIKSTMIPLSFGKSISLKFPNFSRSSKDIHHDYTPLLLKVEEGHTDIKHSEFGQDVIADHLAQYKYFNNFPNKTREHKVLLQNKDVNDPFVDYKKMIKNTLWVFNNEKIEIKKTDKVLCTGGGIGWMLQTAKTIHICDISKVQLNFVSRCLDSWNGNNFGDFVYKFILENSIQHYHINLQEQQLLDKELIKDKQIFVQTINRNFEYLVKKYRKDMPFDAIWNELKNKKFISEQRNILECVKNFHLSKINLSNILDFKYNYITDNINAWTNLISPSTKTFIKSCSVPHKNPYKDPPCELLDLKVPVNNIHHEIQKIKKFLVPHRENSGKGWSSFCIHGKSYDATREHEFYNDDRPYKWTQEAIEYMPKTIKFLKTLGYRSFKRVRVMCLSPKGFINIHRDRDDSKLGPVNIAITHPTGCKFYLEHHGELKFSPGVAYRLNLVNYHAVINDSHVYRYHIIIHGIAV